jgi:hypothetical protein
MAFTAPTMRACKMLIATTFALAALSTAAQAYTPEQEQMCTGDAMRLCSSEIPDVERVTACMVQKRAAQRRLQGRLPVRANGRHHARELRARGKALQAAEPDPAQARLSIFPY